MSDENNLSGASSAPGADFDFGDDSGISEEDRKEITERIEAVSRESRIEVTPALFQFKGTKKAATLPLLANLIGILLIVAGVFGAYTLFQQREQEIASSSGTFTTAEGKLIAELRRQTEEQLSSKDRQMSSVQGQLSDVQVERDEILSEIDERVAQREEELRQALLQELEAERRRLVDAGESEARIADRLDELEARLIATNAESLTDFRNALEDEYASSLARLKELQQQYENELRALQQERLAISRESEEREQEIRERIVVETAAQGSGDVSAPRTFVMEAPPADSPELMEAREQLARIAEEEGQEALIDAQVNGLYREVAESVVRQEYSTALQQLATLRALVRDPQFAGLPGMQQRLEVDLTVARALEALIQEQMADREELIATNAVFEELRGHVEDAQEHSRRGNDDAARDAYLAAFRVLPEVSEGYAYLTSLEDAGTAARASQFAALENEAEEALVQEDYETALARYGDAVSLLTVAFLSQAEREEIRQNLSRTGARMMESTAAVAELETRLAEAETALAEAEANLAATETALEEAQAAGEEAEAQLAQEERTAFQAQIAALRRQVGTLEAAAEAATVPGTATTATARGQINDPAAGRLLQQANDSLAADRYQVAISQYLAVVENYPESTQLDDAVDGINAAVRGQRLTQQDEREALEEELRTLQQEHQELIVQMGRIDELSSRYRALVERFEEYTESEDRILQESGSVALAEAKLQLNAFLTSPPVSSAFPGLYNRVSRYERAFESEGRETAILELIDVVYNLSAFDSPDEQQAFLEEEMERAGEGSFLSDFLVELSYLLGA